MAVSRVFALNLIALFLGLAAARSPSAAPAPSPYAAEPPSGTLPPLIPPSEALSAPVPAPSKSAATPPPISVHSPPLPAPSVTPSDVSSPPSITLPPSSNIVAPAPSQNGAFAHGFGFASAAVAGVILAVSLVA